MDKILKLLRRLTQKERLQIEKIVSMLVSGDVSTLDIKKLKGVDDIYRVRIGNLRIIFKKEPKDIRILDIGRRDENTYRDFS